MIPPVVHHSIRRATVDDAASVAELLHDFNTEFDQPTPDAPTLTARLRFLLRAGGDTVALLGGDGPGGVAVLQFRPAIWSDSFECYIAELYVAPAQRGRGLGRALMERVIGIAREEGATHIEVATGEAETAPRALYESLGFTHADDAGVHYFYQREVS